MRAMTMPTRRDREVIGRGVYWMNTGDGVALRQIEKAGYYIDTSERGNFREHRVGREGFTLAVLHEFNDETFAFLFAPQAKTPWWRQLAWRIAHSRRHRSR